MTRVKKLGVEQVWSLDKEKVMVDFSSQGHPIGDGGGIFLRAMGHLARTKFPIDYETWPNIPNSVKDDVLSRLVMVYNVLFD